MFYKLSLTLFLLLFNLGLFAQLKFDSTSTSGLPKGYSQVFIGSKCGIKNKSNSVILPPAYEQIDFVENQYFLVYTLTKLGLFDKNGKVLIDTIFDVLFNEEHFIFATRGDSSGLFGLNNKWVLRPNKGSIKIDDIGCKNLLKVEQNNKFGIITRSGEVILAAEYELINDYGENNLRYCDNYAFVKNNGKWGVINRKGEWVIGCAYQSIEIQSNKLDIKATCESGSLVVRLD